MNAYEYLITKADNPALNGRVLAFAATEEEAEAQLRSATLNEARMLEWKLVKATRLGAMA